MTTCYGCKNKNTHTCRRCIGWNRYGSNTLINPTLAMDIDKEMKMLAKAGLNKIFGAENAERKTDMRIKKAHFNNPVTVVLWEDGTKTIVRAGEGEEYDPEKGLAMAIAKKALGNQGNYYNLFKKWLPEEEEFKELPESLKQMFDNAAEKVRNLTIPKLQIGLNKNNSDERKEIKQLEDEPQQIHWLSTKQVADMNNISVECVRKQIKDGLIPSAEKVDGKWQIPCYVFDDHVEVIVI